MQHIMSTFRHDYTISKKGKSGLTATPAPERSSFAQTCNLLSQYVKGKGGLSKLLEATAKAEGANLNLLSDHMEVSPPSADLPNSNSISSREEATGMESEKGQMTIFYGGEVLVFDDFPADRATEIMLLARNGSLSTGGVETPTNRIPPSVELQEPHQKPDVTSELPIARRSSLHRFLEKRKDRNVGRGPYQHHPPKNASPSSSTHNEDQLELKL